MPLTGRCESFFHSFPRCFCISRLRLSRGGEIHWFNWLGNLFSLQGICVPTIIDPLWSLSYEVWFYYLTGILGLFFISGTSSRFKIISLALLAIGMGVFTKLSTHYLMIWLLGAFAYWTMPKQPNRSILWVAFAFLMGFVVLLQITSATNFLFDVQPTGLLPRRQILELLFGFAFCIFLQQLIQLQPVRKWTRKLNELGSRLAAFSYTLYLTHFLVLELLEKIGLPKSSRIEPLSLLWYTIEIVLALLTAYALYWFFEKRTEEVKKWLKSKTYFFIPK